MTTKDSKLANMSPSGWERLVREISASVLAVAAFLALEVIVVAILHHAHLTGPWELRAALTSILPVGILAATPIAILAAGISLLLDDGRRGRLVVALTAGVGASFLGWGVTFGRHFHQLPVRATFIFALLAVAVACTWFAVPHLAWAKRRFPGILAAFCGAGVVLLEVANHFILPRLYPAFHMALSVLAVGLAAWTGRPLVHALSRRVLILSSLVVVGLAVVVTPMAIRVLSGWDNLRLLYVNQAPTLAHAVRIAAAMGPTRSVEIDVAANFRSDDTRWLDWQDLDLLIVSIDAVRADHVGAYGYERPTTPNVDELASRGVLFERAYTVMPHTSYAMTSLMTGKYIRPLLMQGTGQDSDTLAGILRTYGYRTAAFHPPSLFVIDRERFAWAEKTGLDFEYRKLEYADAPLRARQAIEYLDKHPVDQRVFLWAHFFEPHEPYAPPPEFDFGPRAIDRYDGEIAAADVAAGDLVRAMLERRPNSVVIITADHGEAFGEHGAYYHGTTVYEEQVRVPLIVLGPGLEPRRVPVPVQLIDLVPTIVRAMDIPRRPRLRGVDLGAWLTGRGEGDGFAFAETHNQLLLAEGRWRLVCERKIDACSLFDVTTDPKQLRDVSNQNSELFLGMRQRLRTIEASHGTYERAGARAEGKDLPPQLVRGMAGDGEAAVDVAGLLDDADVVLRRRAAEVLFRLARPETAPSLSLAVARDEDAEVRRWCALALTRLGHGAPLALELLDHEDVHWRRLAALALAESGDGRGESILLAWWNASDVSVETRKEIANAFANIRARSAVVPLTRWLDNEQLRPTLAESLAKIGEPYARTPLLQAFSQERYIHLRKILARSLVDLGASRELAPVLTRFLGVPDPLQGGVGLGMEANALDAMGGPDAQDLIRLREAGREGVDVRLWVPKGGNGTGFRVIFRTQLQGVEEGQVRFGLAIRKMGMVQLDPKATLTMDVVSGQNEPYGTLPDSFAVSAGKPLHVVVLPGARVLVEGFVVVPLADEIPPPAPEPWEPDAGSIRQPSR